LTPTKQPSRRAAAWHLAAGRTKVVRRLRKHPGRQRAL
jgi:hypothetical protein